MAEAVAQYLERYAEPEAVLGTEVEGRYRGAVVVPMRDEDATRLDELHRPGELLILVVNGTDAATPGELARNHAVVEHGRARGPGVLVVDRSSEGSRFRPDQGVGLARKIGLDIALAAWARGVLTSSWLRTTDADARRGADEWDTLAAETEAVAAHLPYWHDPFGPGDAPATSIVTLNHAVALYEVWLRWHVAGLRWARSAYAHPSIGSCIAVRAQAYAAVRGVPRRRLAGEDFHLLDKLAKLGPIATPAASRVRLRARLSTRVPFGTGPGVHERATRLESSEPVTLPDPVVFARLREALDWLAAAVAEPGLSPPPRIAGALDRVGLPARVTKAHAGGPRRRMQRALATFDGLATVRLLNALSEEHPERPWREAIASAPFVEATPADLDERGLRTLRIALEAAGAAGGRQPQRGTSRHA